WDDLSLKSESPAPSGIAFPGCNRPLDGYDTPACVHLREHWPGAAETRSHGQEVTVFIVRRRPGEGSPTSVESLVDGEPLRQDCAEPGFLRDHAAPLDALRGRVPDGAGAAVRADERLPGGRERRPKDVLHVAKARRVDEHGDAVLTVRGGKVSFAVAVQVRDR